MVFLFPFWLFIFTCFWKWLPWASDGSPEDSRSRKLWWSFINTVILCFSTSHLSVYNTEANHVIQILYVS